MQSRRFVTLFSSQRKASSYADRVLSYNPIAYWPLSDAPGSSSCVDLSGNNCGAVPYQITFGQTGIGDGRTSAGSVITSAINIDSTQLSNVLNRNAGTWMGWYKVSAAADWTDGNEHWLFLLWTLPGNVYTMAAKYNTDRYSHKHNPDDDCDIYFIEGGFTPGPPAPTGWFHAAQTWDISAGYAYCYHNGIAYNNAGNNPMVISTPLDVNLNTDRCVIGANYKNSGAGAKAWKGNIAHFAIFDEALSATNVAALASVS